MQNVYDAARILCDAIKQSDELKQYNLVKEKISGNSEVVNMINDFHGKQMEMQTKQMMGQNPEADFTSHIQQLYGIMMSNPLTAEFLQAELRLSLMINEIYTMLNNIIDLGGKPQNNV